jgi:hypothetical protein
METQALDPPVPHPGSFRDPSGGVLHRNGELFRQVNRRWQGPYDQLMQSGLYARLVAEGRLIEHAELDPTALGHDHEHGEGIYRILKPRRVEFISYPFEWCFSQLKDAALLTLAIQREAMGSGMSLKDDSAFNIVFEGAVPVFIDTLSFEPYVEKEPWVAYRQFCQHFLGPLALASHRDIRLLQLLRRYLDGIPLDLAANLLPRRTRLRLGLGLHLHLHARFQGGANGIEPKESAPRRGVSKRGLLGLIESLQSAVAGLTWEAGRTEWGDYYADTNYTDDAMRHKVNLVSRCLEEIRPEMVWDLGANTGRFSRLASERGIRTVSMDVDPLAVERNYLEARQRGDRHLLPLWMDLMDPTPARGWNDAERQSLTQRGPADLALALALAHHLAIGGNVPLPMIAQYLARIARRLVIEWVPKHDSQVSRLFVVRKDVFDDYHEEAFRAALDRWFFIERRDPIPGTERVLYVCRRHDEPA